MEVSYHVRPVFRVLARGLAVFLWISATLCVCASVLNRDLGLLGVSAINFLLGLGIWRVTLPRKQSHPQSST
jgi:hypothetical protein